MNQNERIILDALQKRGFSVLRNGWPDFLCIKNAYDPRTRQYIGLPNSAMCVEVKAGKDKLSAEQKAVHATLIKCGLPVYTVRAEDGDAGIPFGRNRKFLTSAEMKNNLAELQDAKRMLDNLQYKISQLEHLTESSLVMLDAAEGASDPGMLEACNG